MIRAAAVFAAGTCAGRFLELTPGPLLVCGALAALLATLALVLRAHRGLALAAAILVALTGALNYAARAARPAPTEAGRLLGLSPGGSCLALVTGRVIAVRPRSAGDPPADRLTLRVEALGEDENLRPASGHLRATLWGSSEGEPVRPGERIRVPLLVRLPGTRRSPGAFDYREYAAAQGIWTTGSGRAGLLERLPSSWCPQAALARTRERLAALVRREMPERQGPLLNTILLGWRGEMDPEQQLAFTRTGAGHLLAVSGIHVMLLVGAVWWLLRACGVRPRPAAIVLICFALLYAQLAGARTPVLRAAVMACLLLGGIALGREADSPNSLAAAALLILAIWPRELFSVGFQMSFGAVFFIMSAVPALERGWNAWRSLPEHLVVEPRERLRTRAGRWLRLSVFSSLAAAAGTMPLVVHTFGVISPWAPLVNLLAIPVAGAALASGLVLLVIGSLVPALAPLPAAAAWGALQLLELIVGLAAGLPGASLSGDQPPLWILLAFYALATILFWQRLFPQRPRLRALAAATAILLAIPVSASSLLAGAPARELRVTLPCFGRGRAALLETPSGPKCLIWAGGGGREIVDLLRAERLGTPEMTVLTAAHEDVVSGAPYVRSQERSGRLVAPGGETSCEVLRELEVDARLSPGWQARLGGARLRALGAGPYRRRDGRRGARPLMLLATCGNRSVLFADLSNSWTVRAAAEEFEAGGLRADLVVVGFTWRASRYSRRLLKASGARLALVKLSAFENSEASGRRLLQTLRSCGVTPLSTHERGTLRASLAEDGIRLESFENNRWSPLGALSHPPRPKRSAAATGAASTR